MIIIFLAYFFIASAISANKVLLGFLPLSFFVGLRYICAGMIMITYNYFTSNRMRFSYFKRDIPKILTIALFTTTIPTLLKNYGIKHMLSSKAAMIGSIDPFVTAIYAYILFSEKLTWKKFLGILIGFLGVSIIILAKKPGEPSLMAWFEISFPELATIGAVIIGRYGWILIRSVLKKDRYTPTQINGLTMFVSGMIAFSYYLYTYYTGTAEAIHIPSTTTFISLFAYTVIAGNILGYALYAISFKRYQITFVSIAGFSIPIFVTLIGWSLLGEKITPLFILAAFIIFAGLILFHYDALKKSYLARRRSYK